MSIKTNSLLDWFSNQVDDKERIAFLKIRKALFLGVCYSANIGGTGTLTGTSTNLILNGILKEYFT